MYLSCLNQCQIGSLDIEISLNICFYFHCLLFVVGAAAGGFNGFYNGIRDSTVRQLAGPAKRTQ